MRRTVALLAAWLALCGPAWAAPPRIDIPAEIKPTGQYVTLVPETEAKAVVYVGLSGVEPIPAAVLRDPRMFLLDTRGLRAGRYLFVAVGTLGDEQARVDFAVVVGTPPPGPPPGPPPDPPPGPVDPPPATEKATAATYVYEKDQHAIPNPILAALNRLNRERRITATVLEADTKDGTGEVPEQYRAALAAAKEAGLPALVVTGGGKVLSVVKDPKSEAQVLEAVK